MKISDLKGNVVRLTEEEIETIYSLSNNWVGEDMTNVLLHPALNQLTVLEKDLCYRFRLDKTFLRENEKPIENSTGYSLKIGVYIVRGEELLPTTGMEAVLRTDSSVEVLVDFFNGSQTKMQEIIQDICSLSVRLFAFIQILMLHHDELLCYTDETVFQPRKQVKKRKPTYKKTNKVRVYHIKRLDEDYIKRIMPKRKVTYQCEAWGVRGHYRHYKNGNVIYVRPYTKGKNKDMACGREYALFPREELHGKKI